MRNRDLHVPLLLIALASAPVLMIRLARADDPPVGGAASPSPTPASLAPAPALPQEVAPEVARSPRFAIDSLDRNLGPSRQLESKEATFTYRNDGTAPLHVSARGDCGCTHVTCSKPELEPGGTATLSVSFSTNRASGSMSKTVWVTSDDPKQPTTTLTVRADVSAGIVLAPSYFTFGPVLVGTQPSSTTEARFKDGIGKAFKILSVVGRDLRPVGTKVEFEVTPMDAAPWHGHRIAMRFVEAPPVGYVSGMAIVTTDDASQPRIEIPISGFVSSRVVAMPARPTFGQVAKGSPRRLEVRVQPFDATIALGHVQARSRDGHVTTTTTEDVAAPGTWVVALEVPADAAVGPLLDALVLETDVVGEEITELPITATVVERQTPPVVPAVR